MFACARGDQRTTLGISLRKPIRLLGRVSHPEAFQLGYTNRVILVSPSKTLRLQACTSSFGIFIWSFGIELRSASLQGKHFINWAIPRDQDFLFQNFKKLLVN